MSVKKQPSYPDSVRTVSLSFSFSGAEGNLQKALLCHTGKFDGIYGPVEVTEQLLVALADRYNKLRAKPKNPFDFAPILKDHERKVDNVLGRLLSGLSVDDWIDPETNGVGKGLYGPLRYDDEAALENKIKKGLYSQLSITFDEESFEIYEVSFVAVEAARGSQALAHDHNGGNEQMSVEFQKKISSLEKKNGELKKKVSLAKKTRKAVSLELAELAQKAGDVTVAVPAQAKKVELAIRTVALTAQFRSLMREGRMEKKEFDGVKIAELAAMPKSGLDALMASYANRKPSADIAQHGSAGAAAVAVTQLGQRDMKTAIAAQKSGKKSLADGQGGAGADGGGSSERHEAGEAVSDVKMSDFEDCLKALDAIGPMMDKLAEYKQKMSDAVNKLDAADGDPQDEEDPENEEDDE